MNIKKIIATMLTLTLIPFSNCMCTFDTDAATLEPEIIYTDGWETSYYLDDDTETTYPFIECRADIYNDGTLKIRFWNTHEWESFGTVKHDITIVGTQPYSTDSMEYTFKNGKTFHKSDTAFYTTTDKKWNDIDLNYYDSNYMMSTTSGVWKMNKSIEYKYNIYDTYTYYDYRGFCYAITQNKALCDLTNAVTTITFTPKVEPTGTYNFHVFGHDIEINNDMLKYSEPIKDVEYHTQSEIIDNLKSEIAELKEENNRLSTTIEDNNEMLTKLEEEIEFKNTKINTLNSQVIYLQKLINDTKITTESLDVNSDGTIDAVDSSIILCIYAMNSTLPPGWTPITTYEEYLYYTSKE